GGQGNVAHAARRRDGNLRRRNRSDARHWLQAANLDRGWPPRLCRLVSELLQGLRLMNRRIIPLIMCGGAGTRLWPASRDENPTEIISLFGAASTFQHT